MHTHPDASDRKIFAENGGTDGTRTRDHCIKSAMLYQLSYRPAVFFSRDA